MMVEFKVKVNARGRSCGLPCAVRNTLSWSFIVFGRGRGIRVNRNRDKEMIDSLAKGGLHHLDGIWSKSTVNHGRGTTLSSACSTQAA